MAELGTALRILAQLETEQIGAAVLRVTEMGLRTAGFHELPPGLVPAVSALGDVDPAHPALGVLRESYIADDLGAFLEFWKATPVS